MADAFQDPRIEGALNELNAKLEKIAGNVEEAERKATERERIRRTQRTPARPGGEPTLDDEFRAQEASRQRANEQERAARARANAARAAEKEAQAERFLVRAKGVKSAEVYDRTTGERVRGFRVGRADAGSSAQGEVLQKAQRYADTLNQATRSAERVGQDLIRHPQLFGRQVYTPTGPGFPGQFERGRGTAPLAGVGAAEERHSRALQERDAAAKAQAAAIKSGTTAEVTAATQRRAAAKAEVTAAEANVTATRQEAAAREAHAARLRALAAQEGTALRRTVDYSRFLQGQQRIFQRGQLRGLVDQVQSQRGQYEALRSRYPAPSRPTTGFGLPEAERARAEAGGTLRGTGVGAAGPIQQTGAAAGAATGQVTSYSQAIARMSREQDLAANAARRNGALTTEFIEQAARGRTTIRELGYQVGATIGKFAGWTAAATAVFGAAAAIRELGVGAIDSAEGVNNLTRIIPQIDKAAAAKSIQGLSEKFNVPIGDVGDAAYQISKVFGSIKDPVEAAKATFQATSSVLFAMKVGELDVATATRYLTGIIQGFKLDAKDLPGLFDTINQAQNKFGGNVGQITQGVAQAAGAFSSAGGNYRQLIALIQTGSRVTGRTGAEIGTALRRTADIYQRPERRQTILDLIGIDPRGKTVVEVIEAAMKAVRGAAPELQSQIAKAISTPELASGRILPILRQPALYREISRGISPSASAGSADRELRRALRGPREQIGRLRTELQGLGSELATSGFLAPFQALLGVLTGTLRVLKAIAGLVGGLPAPLRLAAAYALPLGAAVGLARRFDAGQGRGLLGRSAGATTRANIVTGLDAERQAIGGERIARATEIRQASLRVARIDRELATLVGDEEDTVARRGVLVNQRQGLERQIGDAEQDLNGLHAQEQQVIRQRQTVLRQRFRTQQAVVAAYKAEGGIYQQPVLSRPYPGGPIRAGTPFVDQTRGPQAPIVPVGSFVDPTRGPQAPAQIAAEQRRLARYGERFNAAVRPLGTTGRVLGTVGRKTGLAGSAAAAGMARAVGGLAAGGAGLAAALGPLDAIILALVAFAALAEAISSKNEEVADNATRLRRAVGPGELAAAVREAHKTSESTGTKIVSFFQDRLHDLEGGGGLGGPGPIPRDNAQDQSRDDEARARRRLAYIRAQQRRDRLLYQGDIRKRLQNEFGAAAGPDADAERQAAIENAERQYRESLFRQSPRLRKRAGARAEAAITRDLVAQLRGEAAATARNVSAFRRQLDSVDSAASAEALVTGLQFRISRRGLTPTLPRVARALAHLRALVFNVKGEERAKVIEQIAQLQDDVLSRLETKFQSALQSGQNPRRSRRRYLNTAFLAIFGVRTEAELRELQDRRRRLRAFIRAMDAVLSDLEEQAGRTLGEVASGELGARSGRATRRRTRALRRLSRLGPSPGRDEFDRFRQLEKESQDAVDQILEQGQQDAESRLQEAISIYQSRQRNASARALIGASPGARLQRAISDAQSFVGFLQGRKGVDEATMLDAQTAVFEAQDAYAQYLKEQAQALVRARSAFAQSRTYDPIKVELIKLKELQQLLKYAETPAERLQGLADINNQKRQLAQTRQQEKVDQEQFLFDLGKVTAEQYAAWIRRFLRAHKTLRKTNREMFRQLRRQLHQLNQETDADTDLQVGDIRLPTLYDVRRLILQGTRANSPTVVQQTNSYNVNGVTDPEGVASAIGGHQRTAGRAALKAAGLT